MLPFMFSTIGLEIESTATDFTHERPFVLMSIHMTLELAFHHEALPAFTAVETKVTTVLSQVKLKARFCLV